MITVRGAFAYDADEVSQKTGLACKDESLAIQSEKEDADINTLVKRFGLTGTVPVLERVPLQEEFIPTMDYKSALEKLIEVEGIFMSLPADLRARFDHDPGKFLDFTSDEKNVPEMRKLGLMAAEPEKVRPIEVVIAEPQVPKDGVVVKPAGAKGS